MRILAVRKRNEVKPKKKKFYKVNVILAFILISASVIGYSVFRSNMQKAEELNKQVAEVSQEISQMEQENAQIKEILEDDDHYEYFQEIAREDYGYCKPGEKIYYNSSYGE